MAQDNYKVAHIISAWYQDFLDKGDPRVGSWLGMASPIPTMLISLTYVVLVTRVGPWLMRHRQPFQLKNVLIVYNAAQVVASIVLWIEGGLAGWFTFYSYRCQPIDYSDAPIAVRAARLCWCYYILKHTELLDTIFFVLRKKQNQVSTLHVIHHGIMPVSTWFGVKFYAGGGGTFFGFINTFVHIIMYSYYLLAALGPAMQPYLWWKRYLTQLQLLQFIIVIIHTVQSITLNCDKMVTRGMRSLLLVHGLLFLVLFVNFYYQTYVTNSKAKHLAESNGVHEVKKKLPGHGHTTAADGVRLRGTS